MVDAVETSDLDDDQACAVGPARSLCVLLRVGG